MLCNITHYIECSEDFAVAYYRDVIATILSKGIKCCLCHCIKGWFIMREIDGIEIFLNEHYMDIPVTKTGWQKIKYEYQIIRRFE